MSEKATTHIDPQKFAYHFVDSLVPIDPSADMQRAAKQRLAAYLSAYYLIEQFNELETQIFPTESDRERAQIPYSDLVNRLTKLNKY